MQSQNYRACDNSRNWSSSCVIIINGLSPLGGRRLCAINGGSSCTLNRCIRTWLVGWLEFNVPFQHKITAIGYISETIYTNTVYALVSINNYSKEDF